MKAPASHPLADMPVTLPDGRRATVLKVFEACTTAPERCLVAIPEGNGSRTLTVKPVVDLKVAR